MCGEESMHLTLLARINYCKADWSVPSNYRNKARGGGDKMASHSKYGFGIMAIKSKELALHNKRT